jgi:hypothetical protein
MGRVPAREGKTWNQPALVDGVLLVRNGGEMAASRLPDAGPSPQGASSQLLRVDDRLTETPRADRAHPGRHP